MPVNNQSFIETKYRKIVTKIPVPESFELFKELESKESRSMHGQLPIVWDRADGFQIYDRWGNKWIDFTSTIFLANAGHGNKRIIEGMKNVIEKPLLHSYTYFNYERYNFVKYLIDNTPDNFEKVYLVSAGTEATEAALKLMRLNGLKEKKKRGIIISFSGSWHGRTIGAQTMSGNEGAKEWIGSHDPNIFHLPFPYPWAINDAESSEYFDKTMNSLMEKHKIDASSDICGFMIETYQGWGAIFYPTNYIHALKKFAKKNKILIAFDEIQSGFGRTGKLFGYMHYDITPDLITCGKGISSSLPLSAVLGSKKLLDLPDVGSMSSTHSANPLSCIAGHANLQSIIEDNLVQKSDDLGKVMFKKLNSIKTSHSKVLKYILGHGLVAGLIFMDDKLNPLSELCNHICDLALKKGLLVVRTGRESIKLAPPLVISEDALNEGLDVLEECIKLSSQELNMS
tara:strand:+ start:246 stop:1613 length:1368 start_codon:yes stop_codon:yes gene_type:complete